MRKCSKPVFIESPRFFYAPPGAVIVLSVAALLSVPLRALSERFEVGIGPLHNHRHKHLTPQTTAAILTARKPSEIDLEAMQRDESEGLLAHLIGQRARLQVLSDLALEKGETAQAVNCERAILQNLNFVARLLGQLVAVHEIKRTSILISSDYLRLRSTITTALRPWPDAARAVGSALAEIEQAAAKDITEANAPILLEMGAR